MRNLIKGFNDLATMNPNLAKEWHPTKNGKLTPSDVTCKSNLKVWWYLPYDDPKTNKHFDFEWQASISNRNKGIGCPFLSGNQVWKGFNDLETLRPDLAKEWHPTKNGKLNPSDVTCGSPQKVWWYLPYDDPKTNKHFDFEWQSSIASRNNGAGCPFLTSSKTEFLLYNLMKKSNIPFIAEQKFSNCKDKHKLPFDLYLPNENIIIECDGIQHFQSIDYFGGKNAFELIKKHDKIKNQYCLDNNIKIFRIPYVYDSHIDKEKIEKMILNFIKNNKIPKEILNFYKKYNFSNYVECVKKLEIKKEFSS